MPLVNAHCISNNLILSILQHSFYELELLPLNTQTKGDLLPKYTVEYGFQIQLCKLKIDKIFSSSSKRCVLGS
jgi:hypothetical protein